MNDKGEAMAAALEIAVDALCPGDRDGTWSDGATAFLVSLQAQGFTVSVLPVGGGVEVTDEMVERAHLAYQARRWNSAPADSECLRAAILAALDPRSADGLGSPASEVAG